MEKDSAPKFRFAVKAGLVFKNPPLFPELKERYAFFALHNGDYK